MTLSACGAKGFGHRRQTRALRALRWTAATWKEEAATKLQASKLAAGLGITAALCAIAAGLPAVQGGPATALPEARLSVILTFSTGATVMADRLGPDGAMSNACLRSATKVPKTFFADTGRWAAEDGDLVLDLAGCRLPQTQARSSPSLAAAERVAYHHGATPPVCYVSLDGVPVAAISAPSMSVVEGLLRFEDAGVLPLRDAEATEGSPYGDVELRSGSVLAMLQSLRGGN